MDYDRFLSLPQDKQARVINAALKEFAQKGFANASTNSIVKEAGISKGLLFHYFGSKQNLFFYIYDHALEVLHNDLAGKIDVSSTDIFTRFKQASLLKIELMAKYPDLFDFLVAIYYEDGGPLKDALDRRNQHFISSFLTKLFEGIDTSLFKDGVDITRAANIIKWTLDGFSNQLSQQVKSLPLGELDTDKIIVEMEEYFCLLQKGLYK